MADVSDDAILAGPTIIWGHADGPMLSWAGGIHWLTWWEMLLLRLNWTTVDRIACKRWPRRAQIRTFLQRRTENTNG